MRIILLFIKYQFSLGLYYSNKRAEIGLIFLCIFLFNERGIISSKLRSFEVRTVHLPLIQRAGCLGSDVAHFVPSIALPKLYTIDLSLDQHCNSQGFLPKKMKNKISMK